jgi:hypothetical protein
MTYFLLLSLAALVGLIATVLWIVLIVKVFKHAGVGLGILGIFCGPFTYIWGWVKSGEFGLKKLMVWLTLLIVISAALYAAGMAALVASPEMQEKMKQMQTEMQKSIDEAQKAQQQALPVPQN